MRLHARIGLMAMVALASQPADLFAKKRPKPVDAAAAAVRAESGPSASVAEIPALAKLLAKAGWTPTPEMSGYFKVGHIYRPTATGHSRVISDCFEATPTEDTYTSTEVVTQLQAGVGMEFAGMGGGISAGIVKKVKFGTPTHVSLSETDLFPTDDCRNKLNRLAGQQVDLSKLYVVQQVLMAEIAEQTCGRIDASGKFLMLGQAEAAYARACNQFSLEPVAVAYRTKPMALSRVLSVASPPPAQSAPARVVPGTPQQAENGQATPSSVKNSVGMSFVMIPAGSFTMGCTAEQGPSCKDSARPAHNVTLSRSFYMQTTEVTQGQWKSVMGSNPSHFSSCGDDCPVDDVGWGDAVAFAQKLSTKEGLSGGSVYRLPTEAEWEYAARAGQGMKYAGSNKLLAVAWYHRNSAGKTHPVGQKSPNAWGLYDMSGNVFEWTADWYRDYSSGNTTNSEGASSGSFHVIRGGSWGAAASIAQVAFRYDRWPLIQGNRLGFRLARTIPSVGFLTVETNRAAIIYVDDVKQGTSPVRNIELTPGNHKVRALTIENGDRQVVTVHVVAGENRRVVLEFQ